MRNDAQFIGHTLDMVDAVIETDDEPHANAKLVEGENQRMKEKNRKYNKGKKEKVGGRGERMKTKDKECQ